MLTIPYTEIFLAIAVIVTMGKVADFENRSVPIWGGLTLLLVSGSMWFLGHPFIRVILAGGLAYGAMTALKMIQED
jgi:hypothetical protein